MYFNTLKLVYITVYPWCLTLYVNSKLTTVINQLNKYNTRNENKLLKNRIILKSYAKIFKNLQ